ncbi:hypothetical protein SAY87_013257 [Trapa incisa]|uniref:Uncharacterized protein n=1 Tax=Trapa incisa TaxID=236973 RepID=A0AAN7QCX0_9MYRT|nr:hypothetical protein SAY87_013257 [Trapa incisa]
MTSHGIRSFCGMSNHFTVSKLKSGNGEDDAMSCNDSQPVNGRLYWAYIAFVGEVGGSAHHTDRPNGVSSCRGKSKGKGLFFPVNIDALLASRVGT